MSNQDPQPNSLLPSLRQRRSVSLGILAVLAATTMGLLSGTRPPERRDPFFASRGEVPSQGDVAQTYAELRQAQRGPNAAIYAGAFPHLREGGPGLLDPVAPQTPEERAAVLAARSLRRAFAGAPPVVPHAVEQRAPGACLSCHRQGAVIGSRVAPAMSHKPYAVCVQCHAVASGEAPQVALENAVSTQSTFQPLPEPGKGSTAWQGAPPTIPHPTLMRENCASCHGRLGANGLRTPHPYQQSCVQCHASGGRFDPGRPPPLTP